MNKHHPRISEDDRLSGAEGLLISVALSYLLLVILFTTAPAFAAADRAEDGTARQWTVALDNDLYAAGSDRDYTAGFRVTTWRERDSSTQFGLLMYTPDNLQRSSADRTDRPYANLVYLSRSRWQMNAQSDALHRTTVTIGLLGSPLAEALQKAVHRATGSERPRGFDQQIADGGELTARAGWTRFAPVYTGVSGAAGARQRYLSVVSETQVSAGYLTEASLGINLRLSRQSQWWGDAADDFVTQLDEPVRANSGRYWFTGARIKARAYNALLQGQFRSSAVTYSRSELRPWVAEAWAGVATRWRGWDIKYAVRYQSAEIKPANGGRDQVYGDITVSRALGGR